MSTVSSRPGMGWLRDYPDFRDFTMEQPAVSGRLKEMGRKRSVKDLLKTVGVPKSSNPGPPPTQDLRQYCSPIEDQESLGSCTANAGVGLVEYFERRAFGKHIDASRLFLYKVARNLLHSTGDTGAYLRTTMAAMTLFGVPPTEYWPYNIVSFDEEPPAFCYAFAQNYQAIQFFRLDPYGTTNDVLLERIKLLLAAGLPSMFGFTVFSSIWDAEADGKIPFPAPGDRREGGHAVMAVGYDDKLKVKNPSPRGKETKGAFLIRNSWGPDWGESGYGWLPYEYVSYGLAVDWWSLVKSEWIDTGAFQL